MGCKVTYGARPTAPRRDPAPSRWAYRWNRLWLTPGFRRLVRLGMPVLVMAALVGAALGSEARRDWFAQTYADLRDQFQNRPEFMVELLAIEGASEVLADAVRAEMNLSLPVSSFDLDLNALRLLIEGFHAVQSAELRILPSGLLRVDITERLPAMVWRTRDDLWLIDATGRQVAQISERAVRPDLPLIAGDGADVAVREASALLAQASPLQDRLRGLVRVADMRWDLVLDRDQRILLPADDPFTALGRLLAVHQAEGLLNRDILTVDLRNPRRPTVRLGQGAAETLLNVTQPAQDGERP